MRALNVHRLYAIARKEWRQLWRDRRSLVLAFVVPLQQLVLFGYAITWDVRDIPLAVLDQDHSSASRDLVESFRSSGYFRVMASLARPGEAEPLLQRGKARAVLVIPRQLAADLDAARAPALQLLVDGADANTATVVLGYANAIVATWSNGRTTEPSVLASLVPQTRVWYNETLESRNMLVPGLVAAIMMLVASMLSALTLAREWERGTMEQLIATPVDPHEVVIGKLIPYLGIGMVDVVLTVATGALLLGVPFRGSAILLLLASFIFLVGTCAIGMWIGAITKSQRLAIQLNMLVTYLPGFLLSGASIDLASMPRAVQIVSYAVPARYFVTILKGIVLKGVGIAVLWPAMLALVAYAAFTLRFGVRAFHKRLA